MNDKQYMSSFKSALSGLERPVRNEIIAEIESLIHDPDANGESLEQRFGTPQELAAQYMEGEKVAKPVAKRVAGMGKKVLMWVGMSVLLLAGLIALIAWYFSKDRFDYADESAPEITKQMSSAQTITPDGPVSLAIDQGSLVVYWHEKADIDLQCDGRQDGAKMNDGVLKIKHSQCIIHLPKTAVTINSDQAQVVLIRPQADVDVTTVQSELRIAENETPYRYDITATSSTVAEFKSVDEAAHTIRINTTESMIEPYKY